MVRECHGTCTVEHLYSTHLIALKSIWRAHILGPQIAYIFYYRESLHANCL